MNTSSQNLVQPPADLAQIRLASIVESSDDAIIGKDLNGLITSWNHGAEKIFGYPASEILGTSILRLIPADRQEEEKQILLKIKQGESVSHFETLRLRQDGRLVAVSITASPIWDATGRLIGVSKIARDITDRNLVEAELREKAAILEAQLESSLDGILVVDEFGRKILQNQRMNVLMKIPREVADDSDDQQQINWVAGIVKNAAEFKAKVAYLTAHPMETSHDELELKDGTALDRYSAPVLGKDGKYFGRIWTFRDITRHKQEEVKLRESEERFRQMADNITDAFWMTTPDMKETLYVSPAFALIWGRSVASVYANTNAWAEAVLPEDRERVFATFATLQGAGPTVSLEFRIARPDGAVRWIFTRGFQVRDADGRLIRLLGSSTDITDRKLAENRLRESERRFTDMLLNLQLISMMIDRESRITFCNDYLLKLTGWQRAEVLGRDWFAVFAPPERKGVKDIFTALLANQSAAYYHENEILTRSGARLRIAWNNSVLRSPTGEITGIASIGEDITERKLAEATRGRLIAILESTTDLVSISDPAGNFLYLNRSGRNLLGVGLHEDISNLAVNDFIPNAETSPILTEGIPTAIRTGIWSGETVLANRRGQQFPISQVILAHKSEDGKVEYFSSIMRDITQRKHATEELQAANWQLLRANVAKDRLLTITTHDLRGPLTAVEGLADYLKDGTLGPVNEKQVETLNYLTGSVETMLALVNDLLDVKSLDDDTMKQEHKPVDLALLLRWASRVYSPIAGHKQFRLIVDAPESGLEVTGDTIHLKRVLENLVMNAIKFSTPGTQITLGARRAGDGVCVWVDDEGPGVPVAEQEKLFTEYGRTSIHPTGGESSTGLGLAICKRIVLAHGGVISMHNRPTGGAHFEFTLPRAAKPVGLASQAA